MEQAKVLVALGGDRGNSVPRIVTPAEIAVLQAVHGPDAVYDIEPIKGEKLDRSGANELARLRAEYGNARDQDGKSVMAEVYPGRAPSLPSRLRDLDIADEHFKPTSRAKPDDVEISGATTMAYKETGGATGYEPIEVPADPETGVGDQTGMVDPRTQPQIDQPPGHAAATQTDVKDAIVAKADAPVQPQPEKAPAKSGKAKSDPFA